MRVPPIYGPMMIQAEASAWTLKLSLSGPAKLIFGW